jgi:hypothetical protein
MDWDPYMFLPLGMAEEGMTIVMRMDMPIHNTRLPLEQLIVKTTSRFMPKRVHLNLVSLTQVLGPGQDLSYVACFSALMGDPS